MFHRLVQQLYSAVHAILNWFLRPVRIVILIQRAFNLSIQYKQLGRIDDLNKAIILGREALSLCPPGYSFRSISLDNLAVCLTYLYKRSGMLDSLNEAIVLGRESLLLCPPGDPSRSSPLSNLAFHLANRYEQLGGIPDLEEAIVLSREALALRLPGHIDRSMSLSNLAVCLSYQYRRLGKIDDLDEALVLDREALSLCPPGHPDRPLILSNLAIRLSSRYEEQGKIDDLEEAIVLHQEALPLCPVGHPHRPNSLNNLAACLCYRYNQIGKIDDLNEALVLDREALSLRPSGHHDRTMSLSNLALHLCTSYKQFGRIDDLNKAIVFDRESLLLRPPGHPIRSTSLNNLALHLVYRYEQLGGIDDLEEAIVLDRETLSLCPQGNPLRSGSLNNLAYHLSFRCQRLREIADLDEALALDLEALSLRPPGHPHHATSSSNLANHLFSRYEMHGEIDDLNRALDLDNEALLLFPPGHPNRSVLLNNFGHHLSALYRKLGKLDDLEKAIVHCQEALQLCPPGHPHRSGALQGLASLYYARFRRLGSAVDEQAPFDLYAELQQVHQSITVEHLAAAKAWVNAAEELHHRSTLPAYETALRLLVEHLTALPPLPKHLALLKLFSSSLAVDAFSACLRGESPTKAVELLEQGRAVFWSQLTRLRSPLDDVRASGPAGRVLTDEYMRLTSLIRNALESPCADQHDRISRLNLELQKVVSDIRELPDHSRFLLPALFSGLQRAASGGPVIIMNASKYSCDALVVFDDKPPVHIPLPIKQEYVQGLTSKLRELIKHAKVMDMSNDFTYFLRELWEDVVSHVIKFLQTTYPSNSRIWWCPTAEFSLLPLHAASPYKKGQKGVSDLYVSSYTTTLAALIHARRVSPSDSANEKRRILAIGQATAKNAGELVNVGTELSGIGQLVDGLATFTRIEGEDACSANVADELCKYDWVHFACHGVPNQQDPFQSAFALHDGDRFTIQRIIQCNLKNPEFAYLSACHTTADDLESPDEVIHLASAMQFAGFRSVIGTMWAVDDAETNKITSMFYRLMVDDSGRLDWNRAPRALRMTMRKVDVPMDQRILYIHMGA